MNNITIRRVHPHDKEAVIDIASRIWDGEDYIAEVFHEWVADSEGEFAAVCVDGKIAGFGKLTMLGPGKAWLEGLRVDVNMRGLGLGKKLTEYFLSRCRELNCSAIRMATYVENVESIHILQKYNFVRIAEFLVLYYHLNDGHTSQSFDNIIPLTDSEAVWSALDQRQLKTRKGFVSFDWLFQQLTPELVEQLIAENSIYGIVSAEGIEAIIIISDRHSRYQTLNISYIQGEKHYSQLIDFALHQARDKGYRSVMTMCPADNELRQVLFAKGFESFDDRNTNVFLYEHESTLRNK